MKKLYIISGITGAVGNALLAEVAKEPGAVVYGISRKGKEYVTFVNSRTGLLQTHTFICSLGELEDATIKSFLGLIDVNTYSSVTYVHALGHFPFEVNRDGEHQVLNDKNGDGIDDLTYDLSFRVFKTVTSRLKTICEKHQVPVAAFIIGSITDKFRLKEHQSWWRTFDLIRTYMKETAGQGFGMHLVNVSSVICSHEIITRPYVFIDTDADMRFWLAPSELAGYISAQLKGTSAFSGFQEHDLFHERPDLNKDYFSAVPFRHRKMKELFGIQEQK